MSKIENIIAWMAVIAFFVIGYFASDWIFESVRVHKPVTEPVTVDNSDEFENIGIEKAKVYSFTKNGIKYTVIETVIEE